MSRDLLSGPDEPSNPGAIRRIEYRGVVVLTTEQVAKAYGATPKQIHDNFANNQDRFTVGVHFYRLIGAELRAFKDYPANVGVVDPRAPHLYLWPEAGAFYHCKSLNTPQAWKAFAGLVEAYFNGRDARLSGAADSSRIAEAAKFEPPARCGCAATSGPCSSTGPSNASMASTCWPWAMPWRWSRTRPARC
jgi:hypothetical protein